MFTNTEKLAAISRELSFRRYVYPKRIAQERMKQSEADRQIAIFVEIENDYKALADKERLI